jgi:hypothetical protein
MVTAVDCPVSILSVPIFGKNACLCWKLFGPLVVQVYSTDQSTGSCPIAIKALLVRLKQREPRKGDLVLVAPSGLG